MKGDKVPSAEGHSLPLVGAVNAVALVTPLFQAYVVAPDAVNATDSPAQTERSAPAFTVGKAFTVTSTASVPIHPITSVPVTVYVVVPVGVKPVASVIPLFQEYTIFDVEYVVGVVPIRVCAAAKLLSKTKTCCPVVVVGLS